MEWIKFTYEYDKEDKLEKMTCNCPEEDDEILVTNGESVWVDTWMSDGFEVYLDSNIMIGVEATHWMPIPKPPKPQEIFVEYESLAELAADMRISEDYKRGYEAGVAAENERIQELIRGLID